MLVGPMLQDKRLGVRAAASNTATSSSDLCKVSKEQSQIFIGSADRDMSNI